MARFQSIEELFVAWQQAQEDGTGELPSGATSKLWLSFLEWLRSRGEGNFDLGMINADHQFPALINAVGDQLHLRLDEKADPGTPLGRLQQLNRDYKLIEAAKAMLKDENPELYARVVTPREV